jgi:hypothetical protein
LPCCPCHSLMLWTADQAGSAAFEAAGKEGGAPGWRRPSLCLLKAFIAAFRVGNLRNPVAASRCKTQLGSKSPAKRKLGPGDAERRSLLHQLAVQLVEVLHDGGLDPVNRTRIDYDPLDPRRSPASMATPSSAVGGWLWPRCSTSSRSCSTNLLSRSDSRAAWATGRRG